LIVFNLNYQLSIIRYQLKLMLNISLMRMGAKGKPFYRVVVKEKRSKRDGKYLENVGTYNPMTDPSTVDLKHERIQYWISVGAQPTETVASLIKHNPQQTEEEKVAAVETRAAKVAADKQAKADARKAAAEAKQAEIERVAAEKAAAEKAEADAAAQAEADAKAEADAAEAANAETATTEETPAEAATEEEKPASE
jgi:small subunit ribosomal protein S16